MTSIRLRILLIIFLAFLAFFITPTKALAVVQSLNGQTGQTQTFQNDSNLTISSSNNTHSLGWNGYLPVSRGGTGVGSFLAGSLFFFNGSTFAENNSKLFWDNTNNRLGIGTSSPTSALDVVGNTSISGNLNVTGNVTSTNLVPYTGATEDLNLGIHNLIFDPADNERSVIFGMDATTDNTYGGGIDIFGGTGLGNGGGGDLGFGPGDGGNTGHGGNFTFGAGKGGIISGDGGYYDFRAGNAQGGNSNGGGFNFYLGRKSGSGIDGSYNFFNPYEVGVGKLNFNSLLSGQTFTFPNASGTLSLLESEQTWTGLNKFEAGTNSTIYVGSSVKSGCVVIGDSDSNGVTYITANDGVLSASSTKPGVCQ